MIRCNIKFENLVNYVDGTATPAESERIAAHLAERCSSCQEQLTSLQQNIELLRGVYATDDAAPSESSRAFARNLTRLRFPQTSAATESNASVPSPISAVRRWVAELIQPQSLTPIGVRSTRDQVSGQRLYGTSDYLVTLWEEYNPGNDSSYVIGQVYSRQDSVCLIPDSVLFTSVADGETLLAEQEYSEFHVPRLLPGSYMVQCWLNDEDVLSLRNVVIGNA